MSATSTTPTVAAAVDLELERRLLQRDLACSQLVELDLRVGKGWKDVRTHPIDDDKPTGSIQSTADQQQLSSVFITARHQGNASSNGNGLIRELQVVIPVGPHTTVSMSSLDSMFKQVSKQLEPVKEQSVESSNDRMDVDTNSSSSSTTTTTTSSSTSSYQTNVAVIDTDSTISYYRVYPYLATSKEIYTSIAPIKLI